MLVQEWLTPIKQIDDVNVITKLVKNPAKGLKTHGTLRAACDLFAGGTVRTFQVTEVRDIDNHFVGIGTDLRAAKFQLNKRPDQVKYFGGPTVMEQGIAALMPDEIIDPSFQRDTRQLQPQPSILNPGKQADAKRQKRISMF